MSYAAPPLRRPPARAPVAAAPGGPPPLVAPPAAFDPGQRYNAAGQPDVHGGSSANFRASLDRTRAAASGFAAAAPPPGARAVPVTTDVAAGGTPYADQAATYRAPKMGMAKFGDEVRYYPQTEDAPGTRAARVAATTAGQQGFDASVAAAKDKYDADHPPLIDPKTLVAKSVADMNSRHGGLYDAQAGAAKSGAEDHRAVSGSTVDRNGKEGDAATARAEVLRQQKDRIAQLTPAELAQINARLGLTLSQDQLAKITEQLHGAQLETENQTRPGKVAGIKIRNDAAANGDARAAELQPGKLAAQQGKGNEAGRAYLQSAAAELRNKIAAAKTNGTGDDVGKLQAQLDSVMHQMTTDAASRAHPDVQPGFTFGGNQTLTTMPTPPAPATPAPAAPAQPQTPPPIPANPPAQPSAAPAVGSTIVNRQTGERRRWNGTAYEAVQ